jgi:FdhD protein
MSSRRVVPVDEVVCRLEHDGRTLHVFRCTPERYVDLALGWLITEGWARTTEDAPRLDVRQGEREVVVEIGAMHGAGPDREIVQSPGVRDGAAGDRATPLTDYSAAFRELYARATHYRDTGGIHAAAIFQDGELVAHAEDVARHNTVDKVIGAAARAGMVPARAGLVLTARVSGEMARKAARAGLAWIASRSVPTTLALAVAGRVGLSIVARAASADARVFTPADRPLGVILAGGRNRRFGGRPKALEEVAGRRIIERAADALRPVCTDVVVIANDPATYAEIDLDMRPDSREAAGPVGGVREAVAWARERGLPGALVVACDMPFVSSDLLDALWRASEGADAAVPESGGPRGVEPLCAAYRASSLSAIERALERGDLRAIGFFDDADVRRLAPGEVARHGAPERAFFNVNTADDLARARSMASDPEAPAGAASRS